MAYDAATHSAFLNGTSNNLSHTTSGSDRLLMVYVYSTIDNITGVTYAGVSCTFVQKQLMTGAAAGQYIHEYILINPASGANNVTVSSSSGMGGYISAVSYTGARQTSQPDNSAKQAANPVTSLTTSLTTVADNCWLVGYAYMSGSLAAGTATTMRGGSASTVLQAMDSNGAKTPAGSFSLVTTGSSGFAGHVIASIAPVSGNVTVTPAAQVGTFTVPAYTVRKGITKSPSAQVATFSVPIYTVKLPKTVAVAAQVATFTVPAYTISAGGNKLVAVSTQVLTFSVPTYALSVGRIVEVGTQVATLTIPTYSVSAQRSIIIQALTQVLTFSLPTLSKIGGVWSKRARETNSTWSRRSVNDD